MKMILKKGAFVLSIDTELAWGFVHLPKEKHPDHQFREARSVVGSLLSLMEQYEIKATWAIVGHLFLERCDPVGGQKHPEIDRSRYTWLSRDWFEPDPCGDLERNPFWYGPDIVDRILACPVPQEVGCHSFSHVFANDAGCTKESFDSELRACRKLAEQKGISLKSFVFPKNGIAHVDLLSQNRFLAYRGSQPCWFKGFPRPFWRVAHKIDAFFPILPPVVLPSRSDGLWNVPASYYYAHREGWGRCLPIWMRVWKVKMGLRRAAKLGGVFHLWFHPYNLATDVQGLFHGLEQIFSEVAQLRGRGLIDNVTMGELADELQRQASPSDLNESVRSSAASVP